MEFFPVQHKCIYDCLFNKTEMCCPFIVLLTSSCSIPVDKVDILLIQTALNLSLSEYDYVLMFQKMHNKRLVTMSICV